MHQVFISYAWGGQSELLANDIDTALQAHGITLVRDKRDLGFGGLITPFMQQIGAGRAVVLVLSDKYLKSHYCMYELLEVYRNLNFQERIFPFVLPDAQLFEPLARLQYHSYWKQQKEQLEQALLQHGPEAYTVLGPDYLIYKRIFENLGELLNLLKDINALSPELHRAQSFASLIQRLQPLLQGPAQPVPQPTAPTHTAPSTPPDAPPAAANIQLRALSQLLLKGLDDNDFTQLCLFHFDELHNTFSLTQGKDQKALKLIDHCKRRALLPQLLQHLAADFPDAYARFGPYW